MIRPMRRAILVVLVQNVATISLFTFFQTLTSALRESTTAVLMVCATIPRDRTTVHVNLDILEMDGLAEVDENLSSFLNGVIYVIYVGSDSQ